MTAGDLHRVAVVGGGLVGGSFAAAVRARGAARVTVTDAEASVRKRLAALGLADRVAPTVAGAVGDADLVVVATPAQVVPEVIEQVAEHAPPDAILTDVASLKYHLILNVESRLTLRSGGPHRFVGGHPMAGSERSGPDAADPELFAAATWILTPSAITDDEILRRLAAFLRSLGARVLALPAERHDELVALVSHLPQVVASVLADVAGDAVDTVGEAVLAVAGGGFRDTTRIAASDPALWLGILTGNREAVLEALDAFTARLGTLRTALDRGQDAELRAVLSRASAARRRLVEKGAPGPAVDLVVGLADRPGSLAVAATALGEAGINVEDVAMRHAAEGRRGVLLVRIAARDAERGRRALHQRGLPVHLEEVDPGTAPRD